MIPTFSFFLGLALGIAFALPVGIVVGRIDGWLRGWAARGQGRAVVLTRVVEEQREESAEYVTNSLCNEPRLH